MARTPPDADLKKYLTTCNCSSGWRLRGVQVHDWNDNENLANQCMQFPEASNSFVARAYALRFPALPKMKYGWLYQDLLERLLRYGDRGRSRASSVAYWLFANRLVQYWFSPLTRQWASIGSRRISTTLFFYALTPP